MNIAFPAIVIALLILPGAIFRYSYARGSWAWNSPISFRSISDELAYGAIYAAVLHSVWLLLSGCLGYHADFAALLELLIGNFGANAGRFDAAMAAVADHLGAIAVYHLSLIVFAVLVGFCAHLLVRKIKLDLRIQIFRFKNEWYYLLTGEVLYFSENKAVQPVREIDGVYLSTIVDHGKETYLYRGIVADWSFDRDDQLDTVKLRNAHRRSLCDDRKAVEENPPKVGERVDPDDRYYKIRGDLLVLRYSQMKTLNLEYFSVEEEV